MSQTVVKDRLLDTENLQQNVPNILINGGFEIWQRGISFVNPANGDYNADQWKMNLAGIPSSHTFTIQRSSSDDVGGGLYCLNINVTTVGTADGIILNQLLTSVVEKYRGRTLTFTARVKTSVVNCCRLSIQTNAGVTYGSYHTGSGNWETLTVTAASGNSDTLLIVALWIDGTGVTAAGNHYIDSAMLVLGNQSMDYVPENSEIDKVKNGSVAVLQGGAYNLITNGGFERWDALTSFTNESLPPGMGQNFCPGWNMQSGGTGVTWSRESGASNFDSGIYSLKVISTSPGWYAGQTLIGELRKSFFGQTITFSARIKTTQAGKIRIGLGDSATANTFSSYHTGSGNWETLTVTKTINSATTYVGVMFGFLGGDSGVASTVYIDSCMMVWGSVAAPFSSSDNEVDRLRGGAAYDSMLNQSNLVINGGFEVWQRGSSFANLANGAYGPDIWRMIKDGADTTGVVQLTTAGNFDSGQRSARVDITHSTSTYVRLENATRIADGAAAAIRNKTFTVTARIATTLANIRIGIYAGSGGFTTGLSVHASAPNSGSGSFETMTVTGTTNSSASDIRIWIGYIVAGETPVTGYFVVDSVMMVYGATPVAFVPEDTSVELTKCQRWFQIHGNHGSDVVSAGMNYSTNQGYGFIRFPVEMYGIPTITIVNPTGWSLYSNAYATINPTALTSDGVHPLGCRLQYTAAASSFTVGQSNNLRGAANAYLTAE